MAIRIEAVDERVSGCNCVAFYRFVVTLRGAILEVYRHGHGLSEAQALALLVSMLSGPKAVTKLAAKYRNSKVDAFTNRLHKMGLEDTSTPQECLWEWLAHLQLKKEGRGPRLKPRTLVLCLDAMSLSVCPNGYVHLLRDDLALRLEEDEKIRSLRSATVGKISGELSRQQRRIPGAYG